MTKKGAWIKTALKVICSVGLVLFLIFRMDLEKLSDLSWSVCLPCALCLVITLLALLVMSFRWKILVRQYLKIEVPVRRLYRYYLMGSFFNIFLPGAIGGDVIRTQRLVSLEGASLKGATAITLAERAAGVYGLGLLLAASLAAGNFPERFTLLQNMPRWVLWMSPASVLAFVPLLKWALDKYSFPTSYGFIFQTVGVLLVSQLGDVTIAWVFSRYFGLPLPYTAFVFIMPLVYVATVLPVSMGGLGVREGTFAGLMTLYGTDVTIAIAISFLMYLVKVGAGIVGFFVYLKDNR